ncbi:MAG TPA: L,D-transpeptidase family protein [Candidatus Nanopelagicales bacterium]|nr:L,D-transpeptidase family protein [Candidatus Nanopelagicales bacterium]
MPESTRTRRVAALAVTAALAVPAGLAVAAPAQAAPPVGGDPAPAVVRVSLVTSPSGTVEVGRKLRLKVKIRPRTPGKVIFREGAKKVGAAQTRYGNAKLVLAPKKGTHQYFAVFKPRNPDKFARTTSQVSSVRGGPATSYPLTKGMYGPLVKKTQQRLGWAGVLVQPTGRFNDRTVAAVKRFQGKFYLPQTGVMNKATRDKVLELKKKRPPTACRITLAICVDKTRKVAQLIENGKVTMSLDARFGVAYDPTRVTREGYFSIQRKDADHVSSEFHSAMPYSMFFSGGQALHYSSDFAARGYYGGSHGCVNIRDYDGVKKMYEKAPLGTRVVVYRS